MSLGTSQLISKPRTASCAACLALLCHAHGALGYALGARVAPHKIITRAALRTQVAPSMCGVLAIVNSKLSPDAPRLQTLTLQRLGGLSSPRKALFRLFRRLASGSNYFVVARRDARASRPSPTARSPDAPAPLALG